MTPRPRVLARPAAERHQLAEALADRLDRPLTAAGILFALVVLADTTIELAPSVQTAFDIMSWLLWGLFVLDFIVRLTIAPSTNGFLRRNWWQLVFLALPFLRFLRPLARLRIPRVGRIVSSAVRGSRLATRQLSARVAWLATMTVIVVLAGSQVAYLVGDYGVYGDALHDTALAAMTGEPFGREEAGMKILEVLMALYSVVVFAALAGALGAYFLNREPETHRRN